MYFALDHSGGPKQYPLAVGCARVEDIKERVEDIKEIESIIDDLKEYLTKQKAPITIRIEIKWAKLKDDQRAWLSKRINESEITCSGVIITANIFQDIKTSFQGTPHWRYRLLAVWYYKTLSLILPKTADIHIDEFLFDAAGRPTPEMWLVKAYLNTC